METNVLRMFKNDVENVYVLVLTVEKRGLLIA